MSQQFRNYKEFDTRQIPVQVRNCIQPITLDDKIVHIMMTEPCHSDLYMLASSIQRVPLLSIWDLYNADEKLMGYLFQTSGQRVTSSASHLLVQSPALTRQFSVDDQLAEGKVTRMASNPHFNVFHLDLGASLVAQKALGFMSKVLDKQAR